MIKVVFLRVSCSAEKFSNYPIWALALGRELGPHKGREKLEWPETIRLMSESIFNHLHVKNSKWLIKEKSTSSLEWQSRGTEPLGHCPLAKRSTLKVCSIDLEWRDVNLWYVNSTTTRKEVSQLDRWLRAMWQKHLPTVQDASPIYQQLRDLTSPQLLELYQKFVSNPSKDHWMGVKWVPRYIKGTLAYSLMFKVANLTICWYSKKQAPVAKYTTEAEYIALSQAT